MRAAMNAAIGTEMTLFTHLLLREDHLVLYGFETAAERDLFVVLIGVSGLGPERALALLGGLSPSMIAVAVRTRDAKRFQLVKGVGSKLAQRIVLELEGKLGAFESDAPREVERGLPSARDRSDDVIAALIALGFARGAAESAARAAFENERDDADIEALLKAALRRLHAST